MIGTILVTGATGRVGSLVVERLFDMGVDVLAGVHTTEESQWEQEQGINSVVIDFDDRDSLQYAFKKADRLFLLTPLTPNQTFLVINAVEEALRADMQHIVRLSAMGAGELSGSLLGRWHYESDRAVMSADIPYTILRPNVFMENFLTIAAPTIREENSFYMPLADGIVSYIDTRDVAEAAARALVEDGHECRVYTLTGREGLSGFGISTILSEQLQRPIYYKDITDEETRRRMSEAGLPKWVQDTLIEQYMLQRANHFAEVTGDFEKITGNIPITFEKFVQDNIEAFQREKAGMVR